jgi:hypothetical protein
MSMDNLDVVQTYYDKRWVIANLESDGLMIRKLKEIPEETLLHICASVVENLTKKKKTLFFTGENDIRYYIVLENDEQWKKRQEKEEGDLNGEI